jgi:hypothetical protein
MESPPTDVTSRTRVPSRRRRAKTERLVRLQPTSRTGQRHRNKTMDHIQAIQEMIDTNKDEMPVYVATRVRKSVRSFTSRCVTRTAVKEMLTMPRLMRLPRCFDVFMQREDCKEKRWNKKCVNGSRVSLVWRRDDGVCPQQARRRSAPCSRRGEVAEREGRWGGG